MTAICSEWPAALWEFDSIAHRRLRSHAKACGRILQDLVEKIAVGYRHTLTTNGLSEVEAVVSPRVRLVDSSVG